MCDMVSYVKVDDKLLYIDNDTLRDPFVKKLIKETGRKSDVLGHGFIRKAYNIPQGKGKDFENRDFWNPDNFPEEIADKLRNNEFSELWNYMDIFDLSYIIRYAPSEYKEKAWELFKGIKYDKYDLRYIIKYASPEIANEAKILLEQMKGN